MTDPKDWLRSQDPMEWLAAQIDHDERVARAAIKGAGGAVWRAGSDGELYPEDNPTVAGPFIVGSYGYLPDDVSNHVTLHNPAAVLRQVAAYRRILEAVRRWHDPHPGRPCTNVDEPWEPCELHAAATGRLHPNALAILVEVYADREGYGPALVADAARWDGPYVVIGEPEQAPDA